MSVHEFNDGNLAEVLKSGQPVLVVFWASWCRPCREMAPVIEELASENPGIKVGKVDVDENPRLVARYKVMGVPAMLIFKGKLVQRFVGAQPKWRLQVALEQVLD